MKFQSCPRRFALAAITLSVIAALPAAGQVINENTKLLPSDGVAGDGFGHSVAISGTTALAGAVFDDLNGTESGSAYLFDTTTGQQIAKLIPSDGAEWDRFGFSVAISGTMAVVGAVGDDDNGSNSGSAYLFATTTGQQLAKLLPDDGAAGDRFGYSVAISGNTAVVGSRGDNDNGTESGSAYLFNTATAQQFAKLLASDGADYDEFGRSVAIGDTTVLLGVRDDDDNGPESGSSYLFLVDNPCYGSGADLTDDGIVNFFDISVFLTYYMFNNPIADFNGDGVFDFFDVSAFLNAYNAGCP